MKHAIAIMLCTAAACAPMLPVWAYARVHEVRTETVATGTAVLVRITEHHNDEPSPQWIDTCVAVRATADGWLVQYPGGLRVSYRAGAYTVTVIGGWQ